MAGESVITIDTRELDELIRKFPKAASIIDELMESTMTESVAFLESAMVKKADAKGVVGATGQYVQSIAGAIHGTPAHDLRGTVGPGVPHGIYVEKGRRPGKWPPSGPIGLWVSRKAPGMVAELGLPAATFLVQRAIGRRGTIKRFGYKGADVVKETYDEGHGKVLNMWRGLPAKAATRIAGMLR